MVVDYFEDAGCGFAGWFQVVVWRLFRSELVEGFGSGSGGEL